MASTSGMILWPVELFAIADPDRRFLSCVFVAATSYRWVGRTNRF